MSANTVTPYENSAQGKKQQVTQMFNTISGTYDGLNRVISWGSDIKWRKFVVQKVAEIHPTAVLDVATGTGDLAIALTEINSEQLPVADETFDAVTVGFGVRNFEDLEKGLSEIRRVLKPNGRLVVLETSVPEKFPFRQGYHLYTNYVMPLVGKLFSKDRSAYRYLSNSAIHFPYGKKFQEILNKVGYQQTKYYPKTLGGVATIYIANK